MENIVVGIGEALWDMLPEGKKLGGAPANFAYHVSQFGLDGCVVSAVGDDTLGHEILRSFKAMRLKSHIDIVPYPTGTVQVGIDADGIPHYDIMKNVAWDNIPFTPALASLAARAKAVCFGSLAQRSIVSRETLCRFLDAMPGNDGVMKIFDINLRQNFYTKETLHNSLDKCNILKINNEELDVVTRLFGTSGRSREDKCRAILNTYRLKMLILTCGVDGSYVFVPGNISFVTTPKVDVADTVGAGDSFTGAFVAALLKGISVPDAHRLAAEVSAYVCTQVGAMPILPERFTSRLK